MMQLSSKRTHRFVITLSLRIKILKIDKFGDFSCDIDYHSRTYVFSDVISLIINECYPGAQRVAPADTNSRQPRSESKSSALVILKLKFCLGHAIPKKNFKNLKM